MNTVTLSSTESGLDSHAASTGGGHDFWSRDHRPVAAINQLVEVGREHASRKASAVAGSKAAEASLQDAGRILDLAVTKACIGTLLFAIPKPSGDWAPGDSLEALALAPFLASERSTGALRPDLLAAESARRSAGADLKQTAFQVEKVKALIAAEIATADLAYTDASARWRHQRDLLQPKPMKTETQPSENRKGSAVAGRQISGHRIEILFDEKEDPLLVIAIGSPSKCILSRRVVQQIGYDGRLRRLGENARREGSV